MKKKAIAMLLIVLFCSCRHEGGDEHTGNKINLSKYEVNLWCGHSGEVEIISPILDKPEVESDNPQIAMGTIENNKLKISTKGIGTTILHLEDKLNNRADIKIVSATFAGDWVEDIMPSKDMNYKVEVITSSGQGGAELEQEILEKAQNGYRSRFTFDFGGVSLRAAILDNKNHTYDVYNGKYVYSSDIKCLTLEYNNLTESFSVEPISYYIAKLTQDLTESYQKLYPEYEIKKVILTKYLMRAIML